MPDLSTAQPVQAQPSTPQPPQQAPVTTPPAPQPVVINEPNPAPAQPAPAPEPPLQTQPTVEQLQQQLQQRDQQLQQAAESARYHQSQASQFRNALGQVTNGQSPPPNQQDPLAAYAPQIAALKAKGYDDQAARDTVGLFADMVKPLQQEVQQSRAALQGGMQVDQVMQQVYGANPGLFQNQAVFQQTRDAMLAQAMQGGAIDPIQVEMTAAALAHMASKQAPPQQPQPWPQYPPQMAPVAQPIPQPFQNGQFHVRPNFQPPAPAGPASLTPDAQYTSDEMRARFNLQTPSK